MKQLVVVAVALLLASPAAAQPVDVVSVVGKARVSVADRPLEAGEKLEKGVKVALGRHAVAQLTLDGRLAVSLCGGARARLLDPAGDVVLEEGTARITGVGSISSGPLRLELGFPGGGDLLVSGGTAYVLKGKAVAHRAAAEHAVQAGQSARPGRGGLELGHRAVDAGLLRETETYAPPAVWEPGVDPVALDREVKKVRQRVQAQQQREREMASCGCTEGSGPGAQIDRSSGTESRPETRPARIRVRVLGVPKKL